MSFESTPSLGYSLTQPYLGISSQAPQSDSEEDLASTQPLENYPDNIEGDLFDISPTKREILQNFPPEFIQLMQKAASLDSQELNGLIDFIINHLDGSTGIIPFNFFDLALSLVNQNDINGAREVLKLQIAISTLKLFCFFNDKEMVLQKIVAKLKESKRLIELITAPLNPNSNPTLRDLEYMPIYECLVELKDDIFISFIQRCSYDLQWQKNPEDALKKVFCQKGFNLMAHGTGYAKRGLRNLANLIFEGDLRLNIATGPIGTPEASCLRSFASSSHGPFYLLIKSNPSTTCSPTKHLAYVVAQPIDKELLIAIINTAFLRNLISEDQKKLSITRIFTIQEFVDLPEPTISSDVLERHIQTKLNVK